MRTIRSVPRIEVRHWHQNTKTSPPGRRGRYRSKGRRCSAKEWKRGVLTVSLTLYGNKERWRPSEMNDIKPFRGGSTTIFAQSYENGYVWTHTAEGSFHVLTYDWEYSDFIWCGEAFRALISVRRPFIANWGYFSSVTGRTSTARTMALMNAVLGARVFHSHEATMPHTSESRERCSDKWYIGTYHRNLVCDISP